MLHVFIQEVKTRGGAHIIWVVVATVVVVTVVSIVVAIVVSIVVKLEAVIKSMHWQQLLSSGCTMT